MQQLLGTDPYTARKIDVLARDLNSVKQAVTVKTDFDKQISATSDYHFFLEDAKKEAEFLCLQNHDADVVVDPIFKVEFNLFKFKKHYKATIVGFAGHYEEVPIGVEAAKNYSVEDIEKYKLLTDPYFANLYYAPREVQPIAESGTRTYNYNIGANERAVPVSTLMTNALPTARERSAIPTFNYDYRKSKKLRDAGIGLFASGMFISWVIGGARYGVYINDHSDRYGEAFDAGIAMSVIGGAMTIAGIPMWAVGAKRMKKSRNIEFSLNATQNGIGFGLTF